MKRDNNFRGPAFSGEQGSARIRVIMFALWAISISGVAYLLWKVENQTLDRRQGVVVARIAKLQGKVRVKPADSLVWYDAFPDQPLYDGDTVATAPKANASVELSDKESVYLSESSMVAIEADAQKSGSSEINLFSGDSSKTLQVVKGDIVASNNGGSFANSVKVQAKGELFNLQGGGKLGMVVVPGIAKSVISDVNGNVTMMNLAGSGNPAEATLTKTTDRFKKDLSLIKNQMKGATQDPTLDAAFADGAMPAEIDGLALDDGAKKPEKKAKKPDAMSLSDRGKTPGKKTPEEKKPDAPKIVAEDLKSLVPQITSDNERYFWFRSKGDLANLKPIPVQISVKAPKDNALDWTPFIELLSNSANDTLRILGAPNKELQYVMFNADEVAKLMSESLPKTVIRVRTGIISNKTKKEERSEFQSAIQIGRLDAFGSGPVTVQMEKFSWQEDDKPTDWIEANRPNLLSHEISLSDARLLKKMTPLLRAAKAFDIKKGYRAEGSGVHFMVAEEFLASIYSGKVTPAATRKIGKILGSELAYRGRKTDYVTLPTAKVNRVGVVEATANKYGAVYVISRQRVITLTPADFSASSGVLKSLASTITAVFKGEVELEYLGH